MKLKQLAIASALATSISGCVVFEPFPDDVVEQKFPQLDGMPFSQNHTPYSAALVCLAEESADNVQFLNQYRHSIAVGHIKDLTGKYDYNNGGYKITQGASDMMMSALFKTQAFRLVDRNSMEITELERSLATQQLIRDFDLSDNQRLRKITAGEVIGSDYKIVGSINELNYNVHTDGVQAGAYGLGADSRRFVADVGVDLFLVDTKTTQVVDYVSVKKQLVGYETRAGIYRFFSDELFDISLGEKKQEPIQLAVRTALERAVYEFTAKLYGEPSPICQDLKDLADGL